ncbi:MAG: hypothetical protein ACJA1W_004419 [Akkermansiaceae bacterium]|jgi:hypothetical protein
MKHRSLLRFLFLLALTPSAGAFSIDFENDIVGATPDGWAFDGDSSTVRIATTAPSGDHPGGNAIRTDNSGASYAGFSLPPLAITSIQADFRWDYGGTPTLVVSAWDDADNDGFQSAERTIGFGLDNDGHFELNSEAGEIAGSTNFVADTWYRLTMTWSDADSFGNRLVSVSALDLTNRNDLGVVASSTMSDADFGVAPSEWDGLAFRMTRGTIDNIQTTSESGSAFTYIDATPANTTLNTDPVGFPAGVRLVADSNYLNDGSSGSGTDDLWTYRTDAGFSSFEGSSAFESDPGSSSGDGERTADLITTINLPIAGTYEIVAVFTRTSKRDIAAKIGTSPDSSDLFNSANALNANQGDSDFDGSFTNGRGGNSGVAYLGTITTTSNHADVLIFVNGFASTPADDSERTQYDGLGYRSSTVPPPVGPGRPQASRCLPPRRSVELRWPWLKGRAHRGLGFLRRPAVGGPHPLCQSCLHELQSNPLSKMGHPPARLQQTTGIHRITSVHHLWNGDRSGQDSLGTLPQPRIHQGRPRWHRLGRTRSGLVSSVA